MMEDLEKMFEAIIRDIDQFIAIKSAKNRRENFELWDDPALHVDFSGSQGAFLVRALVRKLGLDENLLFGWKFNNKFWQYKILTHYIPGCMAETMSLSKLLREENGHRMVIELCESGYFIKSTLGDSSGRGGNFDRTEELEHIIEDNEKLSNDEAWVLQRKLNLRSEFRIHSFDREIIYGLTFKINGISSNSVKAEFYLKEVLANLPEGLVYKQLIGWDIGITKTGRPYIIEANLTGFHEQYERGFQTSGYFGDVIYGPILCMWLNTHFKMRYNTWIEQFSSSLLEDVFYKECEFYSQVLQSEFLTHLQARRKSSDRTTSAIVYLGEDLNEWVISFLKYLTIQNFADNYYIIVAKKYLDKAFEIEFPVVANTYIVAEIDNMPKMGAEPHSKEQLALKKVKSCQDTASMIKDQHYIII